MAEYVKRYNPNRSSDWNYGGPKWRLSRSKMELFLECPRCFYLDNKLGTGRPRGPAFTINIAVDTLFKKEFDFYRAGHVTHPLMKEYGIDAVPFEHVQMNTWRENFEGVEFFHKETGFTISGAVDDIWQAPSGELIVVDYKSTSKQGSITSLADSSWGAQYARQMGVYQWLLRNNGFEVSDTGYFVYANASTDKKAFDGHLEFEVTIIPSQGDSKWIDATLPEIKSVLDADVLPPTGKDCEFCPYREAAGKKLQAVHALGKKK
jgi:CRISPR/Cas system-associated exonuclease Cas4 (RecB family)